nr:hypothetical protein [Micromonospora sp. DSM 115978]
MRALRAITAVGVAVALTLTGLAAPAAAGPTMPDGTVIATVTAAPAGDGYSTQAVITCTLRAHNPHKSTHVPGTINVVANWSCTAPVASLSLTVILWRNVSTRVSTGSGSSTGRNYAQGNAYGGCTSGTYDGTTAGSVVFPAGYVPPTGSGYHQGPAAYVSCP